MMKLAALLLFIVLALPGTAAMRGGAAIPSLPASTAVRYAPVTTNAKSNTFDLTSFGAVGDGFANDGPALQSALDAIANAGGGTLFVPAGRYAIYTPVHKDFTGLATSVTIVGVESLTPVPPPTALGNELTRGLDLVSEFAPRTGELENAVSISGLETFLIQDIVFIGTPGVNNDALISLALFGIASATVRHCEFYGLSSMVEGGAIVQAIRSDLKFEQSVVLGSACSSGVYSSIIQNLEWKGITISDAVFADYGQREELYGKMDTAPFSWVNIGNAAEPTNDSPRREVVVRNVFFDEGGYMGLTSLPDLSASTVFPIDLLQVTGLFMNVSNFGTTGHYLDGIQRVLIEKSHYGWSTNADSAINFLGVGNAIIDEAECVAGANRIVADSATGKLTVINSIYTHLDSQAQTTDVITTATADEDPVQHVRQQFVAVLGRAPDPAAHFYWSDQILQCGSNAECVTERRATLAAYLASGPSQKFAITGRIVNEGGAAVAGMLISLSGGQSVTTTTDSDGRYHFSNLPTSGVYTVTPALDHHTINPSSRTFVTPAGDQTFDSVAVFNLHQIAGRVTNAVGGGLAGVTVTLSGTQSATVTTGLDGKYSFPSLPANGDYIVTPQKTSYAFSPASQSFSTLDSDESLNFEATPVAYSIGGILVDANNNPIPGVKVTLSGSQSTTTTTDNAGNFAFTDLPSEGDYTVTPTLIAHTFSPPSRTFNNLSANQYNNYQANFTTYALSGRATDATSSAPISGAVVTFAGETNGTATTDANGNYSLSLAHGASYVVTIAKPHYTFVQSSFTFSNLNANQTANFTATLNRHTISGRATAANGSALERVTVNLTGSQTSSTTTNSTGDYSFTNLPGGGNYTVKLSKTSYVWTPPSLILNDLSANQIANFTGTFTTHTLGGRVAENGVGLSGVSILLSGSQTSSATTDAGGNYSFTVPSEGNYTLTPSLQHYTFTAPHTFNNLVANQVADFAATRNRVTISGRVVNINNAGVAGIAVSLSGFQTATTSTNSTGDYSFANVPAGGDYTVTPTLQYHSFTPANYTYTNLPASQQNSFTVNLNTHTISGRATGTDGSGLAGVTVNLTGSQTSSTTTDSTGNYSFASLGGGGNYTVKLAKTSYVWTPTSLSFNELGANQIANFTGSFVAYTLSGRVTENGAGLSGVSILLSGSQTSSATTDAGGNYSFTVPSEGNYTVTPSLQHYTFTTPQTFNNLLANHVADFVANRNRVSISGRAVNVNGAGVAGIAVSLSGFQTATASTNSNGDYSFANVPAGGDYTVAPTLQYHSFTPASYTYTNLPASQQNSFTVNLNTHTISGRATGTDGSGLAGVTVALSGSLGPITATTTGINGTYSFNSLAAGNPYVVSVSKPDHVFNPASRSFGQLNSNQTADFTSAARIIEFGAASYSVSEGTATIALAVTRSGDTSQEATVTYSASNGTGTQGKDVGTIIGQLNFAPAESSRAITIFITDDAFVESAEHLTVSLSNPQGAILGNIASATLNISDNDSGPTNSNPADDAQFFVRQHYRDFLNREPDAAGLAFWSNQILACGADAACVADRRVNVSAAFFLSIEFQETGFLVHRVYKASFAQPPQFLDQFLFDARAISQGVVVDAPGWQQLLENNKTAFLKKFVERAEFKNQYPLNLTPTEFVNLLNGKAGSPLAAEGTSAAIAEFNGAPTSADAAARARVLRLTAESGTFSQRELSPAFVLMQYFGYLQRNPSDPPDSSLEGYNFWLSKLNEFDGDFQRAQMVKSFLVSGEYRSRFGL